MSMDLRVRIVDAFTKSRFGGNSAAVVITDSWLADDLMQSIATENNLSETAFIVRADDDIYDIRWFSPITEIAFCGHATLASAFTLFADTGQNHIVFRAAAVGKLPVEQADDGMISMNFPNTEPSNVVEVPSSLIKGLSIKPVELLVNEQAYFAVYDNAEDVLAVQSNNELISLLAPRDVVVTAPSNDREIDFVSRYFWPANGGDEDPVTGSIHTGLAPYWAKRLSKPNLVAYQASKRGGTLYCAVADDRVQVSGYGVMYLDGTIRV